MTDSNGVKMADLKSNLSVSLADMEPVNQYRTRLSDVLDTALTNLETNKKCLDTDLEEFNSILQNIDFKKLLKELCLDSNENEKGYTLMQQAARIPDARFVKSLLLEANVDANGFTKKEELPVLVAARLGNFRVLQEFKRFNKDDSGGKRAPVNFAVWTKGNEDTVLHLVLTRNTLHDNLSISEGSIEENEDSRNKSIKTELRSKIQSKINDYIRSIDVLVNDADVNHLRDLRTIVNRKNKRPGKTPLHFAVDSWPQAIVKSLLNLGADVSMTYKNLEPILTQIPVETVSEYLSESCMSVEGFEEDTDDEYDSNDEEDEEDVKNFKRDIGECSPAFMDTVRDSNVTFNFRFLLPSDSLLQMTSPSSKSKRKETIKRGESEELLDPEKLDKIFEDRKRKLDFTRAPIPEMQILECITDSKKHKSLLTHPVIKSFVHLKWKKISPLYERNFKFNLIFVYCITWYIFNQFGGLELNSHAFGQCSDGLGFDRIISNNTEMKEFCDAAKDHMKSGKTRENFYRKYNLEGFAYGENHSWHERSQWNIDKTFQEEQSNNLKGRKDMNCNYSSKWYIGFAVLASLLIILEFVDLIKEFIQMGERVKQQNRDMNAEWLKTVVDIPGAILLICTALPVLIGAKELLWLTIFIFILRSSLIEVVQFITCTSQGYIMRYLKSSDNYMEVAIVVLTFLVVFVPNQNIADPLSFVPSSHVKLLCDTSHLLMDNHNYTTTGIGFGADVTVKRKLSAFLIVLTWGHTLLGLSIHPMFQSFRFYMVMFKRVASRFATLLLFYALFVISFGLGFYIMFHNDVGDSILEIKADDFTAFDSPTTSLFKMLAMFLGEIDFNSMPIGISTGRKDGFTSELLACLFLASFMFVISLVLNNLLNGLAVSDTEKIIKEAAVQQTEMYINILSYSDIILHSYKNFAHFLFSNFQSMRPLLYLFDARSYLMIGLDSSENNETRDEFEEKREVLMKTEEWECDNLCICFLRKVQSLLFWYVSEVQRKNIIIGEAKQIIIDRKKGQIQERLFLRNEKIKELDFIKKIVNTIHNLKRDSSTDEFE